MIVATVQLVLDCHPSEAPDAINEILRGHQRAFSPDSCLVDYAVCPIAVLERPTDADTSDYVEGEAFVSM